MKTVLDYLKQDRQWRRIDRIAHAEYQLARATIDVDRRFWLAVLTADGARS
jgi:hypothetical protein